jgi:acetyltransferase-like isoleucine patch superfamily enzyme
VNRARWRSLTPGNVRRKVADERRARKLASLTARVLTPPDPSAYKSFGPGSVVVPPSRVSLPECIEIGEGVVIHEHAWLSVVAAVPGTTPRLTIGDGTSIGRLCHIACVGEIEIGPDVLTSERIFIGDTYHGYEDVTLPVIEQPMAPPAKVTIGRGAFLGVGSVVLRGVTVGEHAYVGAGAVVTADVAPHTVVVGNPARVVRRYDDTAGRWID